jgi:hypothetical protein
LKKSHNSYIKTHKFTIATLKPETRLGTAKTLKNGALFGQDFLVAATTKFS